MKYEFTPIGTISTPFTEKFGVPRQSLLMSEAKGIVSLVDDPSFVSAVEQLLSFSHVWIIYVFHKNLQKKWHPLVETPRLEAGQKIGLFATRSPHRPNPIGISAAKLDRIAIHNHGKIEIFLSGIDILDGTPILDIKPYLPYADRIEEANSGWIKEDILSYPVKFQPHCLEFLAKISNRTFSHVKLIIEQMLALDPRPTSQRRASPLLDVNTENLKFAFRVLDLDVHWSVCQGTLVVYNIIDLQS